MGRKTQVMGTATVGRRVHVWSVRHQVYLCGATQGSRLSLQELMGSPGLRCNILRYEIHTLFMAGVASLFPVEATKQAAAGVPTN